MPRANDVSGPGNSQRARQHLPFLQRAGKLQAMVESVSSGEQMGLGVVCVWGGGDVER